jgi:importin subunit beta-1
MSSSHHEPLLRQDGFLYGTSVVWSELSFVIIDCYINFSLRL